MNPSPEMAAEAGRALLAEDQYALAIEFLRRAPPSARLDLATAELASGDLEKAAKDAEGAPESGDAHVIRAMVMDASGRSADAAREMRKAVAPPPVRAVLAVEAMVYLIRSGDAGSALRMADAAIKSVPEDKLLRVARVAAIVASGEIERAIRETASLERRWPEWWGGYVAESLLLQRAGRKREAAARLDIAEGLGASRDVGNCGSARGIWATIGGCESKAAGVGTAQ
jgi:tetratricopeptide (TPR) repeat protein